MKINSKQSFAKIEVTTTIGCDTGEVKVYDCILSSLDKESLLTVMKLFSYKNKTEDKIKSFIKVKSLQ